MGIYRSLLTGFLGTALLTLSCTSQALTLTPKQEQHLAEARKEMGLGPDDMLKRHICLWDLSGRSGPIFNGATTLRLDLLRYKIDISLEAFTNESAMVASLKNGQCDAALMSGFRARQFNRFTGTIDAIGAIPDNQHMRTLLQVLAHPSQAGRMVQGEYVIMGIFSGGAAKGTEEVLEEIRGIAQGGGFGSIMGRNAFQRPKDEAISLLHQVMDIHANA